MTRLIDCSPDAHGTAILSILNEAIVNSTALYDYRPRTIESMAGWFAAKREGGFPVIGAVDDADRLLGFTGYGTFRAWPAYKYTVEHSVYIHHSHRGLGIGERLLTALIARARTQDVHVMIGGIDIENAGSIALHRKLGFELVGTVRQAGFKFGRWLDLGFYQLTLETPLQPVDG
jgi:L-amino acid N-acyltransferase YncA